MTRNDYRLLLGESLAQLDDAVRWLKRSYGMCRKFGHQGAYTEEEYDAFETLTSRFARVSDIILQKVLRNIDKFEMEASGTLLDVLNRAEKRGLIHSADSFWNIRELRNEIAHEYSLDDLYGLFKSVLAHTTELFTIVENIKNYCQEYMKKQAQ